MTVIDIGANIGYHTLLFSKWVKPYGKIFAFEPDPTNFKLLKKNITANQIKNIVSFKNAVSDKNDKISLFLSEDNSGDHRINDLLIFKNDNMRKKIGTHSVKLDSVFSKSQKIDFIKIDIQGSEIQALNGMQNILKNRKNISMLIEFWPYAIQETGHEPRELIEILKQLGFDIFSIKNTLLEKFDFNHPIFENFAKLDYLNLYCIK